MVSGTPPDREPVAQASRRIRTTAIVVFVVAVAAITTAVSLDTMVTRHGPIVPIVKALIMTAFIAILVYTAYRIGKSALLMASAAEEARLEAERKLQVARENELTEQVETNRRLLESEERYRTQFETSVDGIVFTGLDGMVVDCNETFARMLGYEVAELIGTNVWALTPREWRSVDWDVLENQILPTGRSDKYEKEYRRKDGSRVPVSLRVWAVNDEEGSLSGVWGRVEDLSQQKQYEDFIRQTIIRLEQANERLREVDRLKTEFVGMVSHELRAPIATMTSGFAALRALGDSATEEQRHDVMEVLERGTTRLRHLVDDLLDISRIESGQLKLELREVDAIELATRVMDLYAQRCEEKGIELSLEHTNGSRPIVCDPRRVEQVLTNLIDNALKFTDEGSVTVRLECTPSVAIFTVSDSGPGITPSLHEQVFEKFFTAEAPSGQQGVGLGLAISKGIVEAHNGRMWVESRQGSGATFGFELPISP
ncbi:MAG: sensor histidine kinase [Candidatus Geothermincolia bacterium]